MSVVDVTFGQANRIAIGCSDLSGGTNGAVAELSLPVCGSGCMCGTVVNQVSKLVDRSNCAVI